MKDEIQKSLDEVIGLKLRNLVTLNYDSEAKSNAVKDVTELYKLRIEEAKLEAERADRERQLEEEKMTRMAENHLKHEQLRSQAKDRWVNLGIQVGLAIGGWVAYDIWNRRGLKFEETGTIVSPMTKNLLSRMLPKMR